MVGRKIVSTDITNTIIAKGQSFCHDITFQLKIIGSSVENTKYQLMHVAVRRLLPAVDRYDLIENFGLKT